MKKNLLIAFLVGVIFTSFAYNPVSAAYNYFTEPEAAEIIDIVRENFDGGDVKFGVIQIRDSEGNKRVITATSVSCFDSEGEPVTCS